MLNPQVSPEEIKGREVEVELGLKVELLLHQLFLNSSATDIVSPCDYSAQLRALSVLVTAPHSYGHCQSL